LNILYKLEILAALLDIANKTFNHEIRHSIQLLLYEGATMKRLLSILIVLIVTSLLSGCIIYKIPSTNDYTMNLGEQLIFSVNVIPPAMSYTWTLDGAPLSNTGKSVVYTVKEGKHTITVMAVLVFVMDKQTWNIYGKSPRGATSGGDESVAIDSTPQFLPQAQLMGDRYCFLSVATGGGINWNPSSGVVKVNALVYEGGK